MLHQSLPKEERKTKMKDEAEGQGVLSRGVGGAAPTEGSGDMFGDWTVPNANFMTRKVFFGLMVLEIFCKWHF